MLFRGFRVLTALPALLVFAALMPSHADVRAHAPRGCGPEWAIVASPNPGAGLDELFGVAAVASDDVWAVGSFARSVNGPTKTLVVHWDGEAWTVVPSPNGKGESSRLLAVSAVSGSDVWAVGSTGGGGSEEQLIEHWDGTSWSISPPPDPEPIPAYLTAVSARSAKDVWAVGEAFGDRTLVEHWNGVRWKTVRSPSPGDPDNELFGVVAIARADAWAVGDFDRLQHSPKTRTLSVHWDGTSWTRVASPSPDPLENWLYATDAASSAEVWAVGRRGGVDAITLTERWDGHAWSVVPGADVDGAANDLRGVEAIGPGDVWAVGFWQDLTSGNEHTLAEHWNGAAWSLSATVDSGRTNNTLTAVTASGGTVWAVGRKFDGGLNPIRTLVERVCP